MRKLTAVTLIIIGLVIIGSSQSFAQIDSPNSVDPSYYLNSELVAKLFDPNMESMSEIILMRQKCQRLASFLDSRIPYMRLTQGEAQQVAFLRELIDLHLKFNQEGPSNEIISLTDPGYDVLLKLQKAIHLPPPTGFAFVKNEGKRRELEKQLKELQQRANKLGDQGGMFGDVPKPNYPIDEGDSRPANTQLTRYITLDLGGEFSASKTSSGLTYKETVLSHELVHVYVNCLVGFPRLHLLPEWFNEGLATYLVGDAKVEEVTFTESGSYTQSVDESKTYKKYHHAFDFLHWVKGDQVFESYLTESIKSGDANQSLREHYGFSSINQVYDAADRWDNLGYWKVAFIILTIICLWAGIGVLGEEQSRGCGCPLLILFIIFLLVSFWIIPNVQAGNLWS